MVNKLKIKFIDFWEGFDEENNWFLDFLKSRFNIELTNSPDFLIYSDHGFNHLKYNCIKIFFTGENNRPNFLETDFSIGFDFISRPNHLRLPLYVIWDQLNPTDLLYPDYLERVIKYEKTKFCSFVVSNPICKKRNDFFLKLSKYKKVDSGGRLYNNIGYLVEDKLKFMSEYKFNIAFENSSYDGYVTEKVYQPFFVNSIPIYWGSQKINFDFNKNRILNWFDFGSDEALIEKIIELDSDNQKYLEFINQPIFNDNKLNEYFDLNRVENFFKMVFTTKKKPISQTNYKFFGMLERKRRSFLKKIKMKNKYR